MNLKESFRYQNFLESLMRSAVFSVTQREHCLTVTKSHLRSKSNADATDITEVVEVEPFYNNDDVLKFMQWLVEEKSKLTQAVSKAKTSINIDLDAAIETNKFRQQVNSAVKNMLRHIPRKTTEQGRDFKFNAEGNQMAYFYEIEVTTSEAYDKLAAKELMRSMITEADETSAKIDAALINTQVDYEPRFDVNESFDDVMEEFVSNN